MLPRAALTCIFGNFVDILQVSAELLGRLESGVPDGAFVGDALLPVLPFFKMYTLFVKNFSASLQCIDAERRGSERCERILAAGEASGERQFAGLSLQAQLLAVVQRVPRYRMLLAVLLKHTPPTHADYAHVRAAHAAVEAIAVQINETVREHEHTLHVLELQRMLANLPEPLVAPGRRLVLHGTLRKTCRRAVLPRHVFLFSDCIMYARMHDDARAVQRPACGVDTLVFRRKLPLHEVTVMCYDDVARHDAQRFDLRTSACSFALFAPSRDARDAWVRAIRETQAEHFSALRSLCRSVPPAEVSGEAGAIPRLDDYVAPVWVPDSMARRCAQCGGAFGVWRWRHHCRICGCVVCAACSTHRFAIPHVLGDGAARACDACFETTFGGARTPHPVLESRHVGHVPASAPATPTTPSRPVLVNVEDVPRRRRAPSEPERSQRHRRWSILSLPSMSQLNAMTPASSDVVVTARADEPHTPERSALPESPTPARPLLAPSPRAPHAAASLHSVLAQGLNRYPD